MKLGILIDSSATNENLSLVGTNIKVIPLHITLNNDTDILDTADNIEKNNIYSLIKSGADLKTSQASPGELEEVYDSMLKEYEHVIHIPITQNLSNMLQTSMMVANDEKFEGKITVYNNVDLAANLIKIVALEINDKINKNEISNVEQAVEIIEKIRKNSFLGIVPGDLKKLAKGGRGAKAVSSVLNMLKTKVLIRWQAEPKKISMSRTISSIIDKIEEIIAGEFKNGFNFIFVRTPFTNEKLYANAKNELNRIGIKYSEEIIPSIYTIHAGIDTLGFIIYEY